MFSKLKLQARYALLPVARYIRELIAPVFVIIIPLYFLLFLITVYYPQFYPLRLGYALFISLFAFPVIELVMQVHLILSASGRDSKVKISFKYAMKSCALKFILRLIKIRNFFVFQVVPLLMLGLFFFYLSFNQVSFNAAAVYLGGTLIVALAGFAFFVASVQKYSRALFCLAAYENISPLDAVRLSKTMAEKSDGMLLPLRLSFLPWFALGAGVFPLFFVIPYYKQSITCYFMNNR